MAAALPAPTKGGEFVATPEGTPTYHDEQENIPPPPPPPNVNNSALPPPPADDNNDFNFDQWLLQNNLINFRSIFIKHKMTTFETINTSNTSFASLISEPKIIESNTLSSLVIAIQKLHFNKDTLNGNEQSEPSLPNNEEIVKNQPLPVPQIKHAATEYIVVPVSQDEHNVLTQFKQGLNEMNKIKIQLKEIENDYILQKNKVENNKVNFM